MIMAMIVIFDENGIVKINVTEKSWEEIEYEYDNNIEAWMTDKGIDEKVGVNLGCANWQVFEDEPETKEYTF